MSFFQTNHEPWTLNSMLSRLPRQLLVISLISVCYLFANTGQARAAGSGDCGQVANAVGETETSISSCMGELLESQENMIEAVEGALRQTRALNLSPFGMQKSVMNDDLGDKIQFLRDEHKRAKEANDAVESNDYDEMLTKADQEKGKKCKTSDMPFYESLAEDNYILMGYSSFESGNGKNKLGNGKCDFFSAIKDDGTDVWINERAENMCQEVCADKINTNGSGKSRKEERKQRVVGRLTDGIYTARRATDTINDVTRNLAILERQLIPLNASMSTKDICESDFDVAALLEIIATGVSIANSAVSFTTAALETAENNVKPAANQTVAGFNAGSAVIPFALVAGISKMVGEVVGAVEKGLVIAAQIVSASADDTNQQCLKSVRDNGVDVKADVTKLKADTALLKNNAANNSAALAQVQLEMEQLKQLLEQNQQLLLTPQGKREGFN